MYLSCETKKFHDNESTHILHNFWTSTHGGKLPPLPYGGNVTSAGWQVTLCDPMWHVSSRSGVATLRTAIPLLFIYLLFPPSPLAAPLVYRYRSTTQTSVWFRWPVSVSCARHLGRRAQRAAHIARPSPARVPGRRRPARPGVSGGGGTEGRAGAPVTTPVERRQRRRRGGLGQEAARRRRRAVHHRATAASGHQLRAGHHRHFNTRVPAASNVSEMSPGRLGPDLQNILRFIIRLA